MPSGRKVPADRLVLALVSVLRTLIHELHKERAIEIDSLLATLDASITTHRERGDPNELADAIEMISNIYVIPFLRLRGRNAADIRTCTHVRDIGLVKYLQDASPQAIQRPH
jgi:hypothetical protein